MSASTPTGRLLEQAATRLRRPAGRPRRLRPTPETPGWAIDGAPTAPARDATISGVFAHTLPPRGLSVEAGAAYLGVSRRELYRFVERGLVHLVRLPGCRRVLVDRLQLDGLLTAHQERG